MNSAEIYRKAINTRKNEVAKAAFEDIIPVYLGDFTFERTEVREQYGDLSPTLDAYYVHKAYTNILVKIHFNPSALGLFLLGIIENGSLIQSHNVYNEENCLGILDGWKLFIEKQGRPKLV